jgi:hypothetical protein
LTEQLGMDKVELKHISIKRIAEIVNYSILNITLAPWTN